MRAKKCICCDDTSVEESRSLDDNERKKLLKKFKCKLCSKSYTLKKSLLEHKKAVHKRIKYDCELCNKSFGYKKLLQKHIIFIHKSVKKTKKAQRKDLKMCQENVREGVKKFSCDLCEKKFCQKVNLKNHVLKIHEGFKRFKCEICKKLFSQKAHFESHQHCQICGKAVCNENVLKRHMSKFHENIKTEKNEKKPNEKTFSSHKNKIHKKLKNCEHENGSKTLIQPSPNQRMQEIIEKDIGYCCEICGRVFATISTLEKHTLNIHNDNVIPKRIKITGLIRQEKNDGKPIISVENHVYKRVKSHKCNFCSKTFIRSNYFVKHVVDIHQK